MRYKTLLIVVTLNFIIFADDAKIGLNLISKGAFEDACEYINRAYRKNPFLPIAQFAYARITPDGTKAKELYVKVIRNREAPDSLKAESLYMLGCMEYCKGNYEKANEYFNLVRKIVRGEKSGHVKALTALMRRNFNTAETIWKERISGNKEKDRELYYLGNTYYKQENYEKALDYYLEASQIKDTHWAAPSMAGACLSALNMGNVQQAKELKAIRKKGFPVSLETKMLQQAIDKAEPITVTDIPSRNEDFSSVDLNDTQMKTEPIKKAGEVSFSLQVGAFSKSEYASIMAEKMKKDFDDVSIVKEKVHKKIFHKVRIGTFSQAEEASVFAEKELKTKGINYRVVKVK